MRNAVIGILVVTNVLFAALLAKRATNQPKTAAPAATGQTQMLPEPALPDPNFKFAYLTMELNNPYWRRVEAGMKEVCEKLNASLSVQDPQLDSARQVSLTEDLLQGDIDVLLLSPVNDETCTKVEALCSEKGVPVVVVDVGPGKGDYACLTISDNRKGGYLAGKLIHDRIGGRGKVKVGWLQIPQAFYAGRLRTEGFQKAVDEFGFEVIGRQEAATRKDLAVQVMEDYLVKAPDLNAVFSENDEMALGAMQAIKAAGNLDQITIVGFDGNPDAIEAIKKGQMAGTVAQDPEMMGRMAIVNAFQVLAGTLDKNARRDIYVPIRLITVEEVKGE